MIYLSYSFQFLSFAAGMVSLFIAVQLFQQYKFDYLKSNIYLMIGYLVLMLFNSIDSILNIINPKIVDSFSPINQLLFFVIPLILLYLLYHFRGVFDGLSEQKRNRKFGRSLVIITSIFILFHLINIIWTDLFLFFIPIFVMLFVQIIFFIMIFNILIKFKKKISSVNVVEWKRSLIQIFYFELIYFIILLIVIIAGIIGIYSNNILIMISSFLSMIINPVMIYLFVRYHRLRYDNIVENRGDLFIHYNITEREKEIIELVCSGKTNKEIADVLFLSPLTVRDHLSNIFKKIDVKNRTQLASLFNK